MDVYHRLYSNSRRGSPAVLPARASLRDDPPTIQESMQNGTLPWLLVSMNFKVKNQICLLPKAKQLAVTKRCWYC
ncbi:hypothetical protein Ancab_005230 [Ancistrocladus abbreviatus]